ncbi:MAG: EscU/YscU/HrcU family type III secretion system export apparatus switch protein [Rhodocyclaceae bacterium]|nr:EscU/YscU/HrcU family type III secretion system export apparatus switch protein [Rhodocyclaceae bacterium]MDQ7999577.1 EscU/YscU/HrcU family type III secretion system export apparatus switch protein [Pseudomonadota bacterium]MDQ8015944.1 EscU/YscU/HrcU family type III secretion system export apparatus switch protein [Pseudomonadota bacterium]
MSSSQDKTLPATQRKLEQARKDGQVARSRDLAHLAVVGSGAVALLLLAPTGFRHMREALAAALRFNAHDVATPSHMLERLAHLAGLGLVACIAFAAIVAAAAVASTVAAGGWIATAKPITPDFAKLNPLSGLRNLLSKQQFANVAKLVLLSLMLAVLGWLFVSNNIDAVVRLVLQPSPAALAMVADWMVAGMALVMLVLVAAAVVDVPLQAYFHQAKLRMSHQEVKQEHKESDGDPHLKGRMRSAAREIAQRSSITAVPRADFILMNPTHYAVALRYDESTMNAPHVISKGADLLAMKIREVATEHRIPVVQSPVLARALYAHAELDRPIPTALYTAVAQILAYVYRLKAALRGEGTAPTEQPDPQVPPELDPHHIAATADTGEAA